MQDPTAYRGKKPPRNTAWKRERNKILAGIAMLAITLLLLAWGLSALSWTTLANAYYPSSNDVSHAVFSHYIYTHTFAFSNPPNNERIINVNLSFGGSSISADQCYTNASANTSCTEYMPAPASDLTTTTQVYVLFFVTDNAHSPAIAVFFTGPQGRLNYTGYSQPEYLEPYTNVSISTQQFFETPIPGNYSAHIVTYKCGTETTCATTNSTGSVTTALAAVAYNRPFSVAGLATVVIAAISMAFIAAFLSITSYRVLKRKLARTNLVPKADPSPDRANSHTESK